MENRNVVRKIILVVCINFRIILLLVRVSLVRVLLVSVLLVRVLLVCVLLVCVLLVSVLLVRVLLVSVLLVRVLLVCVLLVRVLLVQFSSVQFSPRNTVCRDYSMLWFGGYLLRFHSASDWLRNNKHSRHYLWCSRFLQERL